MENDLEEATAWKGLTKNAEAGLEKFCFLTYIKILNGTFLIYFFLFLEETVILCHFWMGWVWGMSNMLLNMHVFVV